VLPTSLTRSAAARTGLVRRGPSAEHRTDVRAILRSMATGGKVNPGRAVHFASRFAVIFCTRLSEPCGRPCTEGRRTVQRNTRTVASVRDFKAIESSDFASGLEPARGKRKAGRPTRHVPSPALRMLPKVGDLAPRVAPAA
jgi:hypothetical protein